MPSSPRWAAAPLIRLQPSLSSTRMLSQPVQASIPLLRLPCPRGHASSSLGRQQPASGCLPTWVPSPCQLLTHLVPTPSSIGDALLTLLGSDPGRPSTPGTSFPPHLGCDHAIQPALQRPTPLLGLTLVFEPDCLRMGCIHKN